LSIATDTQDWALDEFGSANLGDARRNERLVELARQLGERPETSLPQALENGKALKAAYRFFDNAQIAHEKILAPHVASSIERMRGQEWILAVQDTTFIDYSSHPHTEGLGPLHAKGGWGMICHGTLAFTPQSLPLGVLGIRLWTREVDKPKRNSRRARAIEDKESHKWIDGLNAAASAAAQLPGTRVVSVADRESDVYEFLLHAHTLGIDVLTRASWDRNVEGPEGHLFAALAAAPVIARKKLRLPARKGQAARTAKLKVRACPLTLQSPLNGSARGLAPISLWGVWAHEINPPAGVEPLDWKLLTTNKEALERLDWYAARWGIEVWHRVLKSGCRIEKRQLESFDRLCKMFTIYAVIAWRILYATMLARVVPDMACTAILNEDEWQALYCRVHHSPTPPATAPPLRQAVRWIAKLGGFIGRASDGEPGSQTLWKGFQELIPLTEMYRIMKPRNKNSKSSTRKNVGND
jgi:Transposase DNA-binding/Transposase Tn5 dimerisation domain